jgi:hypothetical protein
MRQEEDAMNLGSTTRWYYRIPYVLLLLFCVLGPFGLPLLWKSPDFKRPAKVALTLITLVFTGWLVWRLWVASAKIIEQFGLYAAG